MTIGVIPAIGKVSLRSRRDADIKVGIDLEDTSINVFVESFLGDGSLTSTV